MVTTIPPTLQKAAWPLSTGRCSCEQESTFPYSGFEEMMSRAGPGPRFVLDHRGVAGRWAVGQLLATGLAHRLIKLSKLGTTIRTPFAAWR